MRYRLQRLLMTTIIADRSLFFICVLVFYRWMIPLHWALHFNGLK